VSELQFIRKELVGEVEALKKIAGPFLDVQTEWRLDDVLRQLRSAPRSTTMTWEIPRETPLMTILSEGEYEQEGRQGGHHLVGSLSFSWHLRLNGHIAELNGNATTKLVLVDPRYDQGDSRRHLGIWRMEIGASDSPGACFHAQVVGNEVGPPFPPSLPVPRLPTLVPTPMAVLEFLLSELFQDRWRRAVGVSNGAAIAWRNLQRARWRAFLSWQQDQIRDGTPSPWTALKRFPPADVFVHG
jgi:hypothetical protein